MVKVAIALGSNLGDRAAHLDYARRRLDVSLSKAQCSDYLETDPVGVGPQPRFLNAVLTGETTLTARALVDMLLAIERERSRERPHPGAARTLDLDLVLYGGAVIDEAGLQVPHPRFRQRRFVLAPLAEIAADWVDPVTSLTVAELLRRFDASENT